jgi:hypothetical protein
MGIDYSSARQRLVSFIFPLRNNLPCFDFIILPTSYCDFVITQRQFLVQSTWIYFGQTDIHVDRDHWRHHVRLCEKRWRRSQVSFSLTTITTPCFFPLASAKCCREGIFWQGYSSQQLSHSLGWKESPFRRNPMGSPPPWTRQTALCSIAWNKNIYPNFMRELIPLARRY